jgi:hypothetical protein
MLFLYKIFFPVVPIPLPPFLFYDIFIIMNNIEQYRNRFFNLMESTIGDVRPLITEQINPDDIKEYKGKWSISNMMKNEAFKKMYKDAIDKNTKINGEEDATVVDYYNRMVNDNRLDNLVSMYDKSFPSSGENTTTSVPTGTGDGLSKSPITTVTELTGDDLTKFYNVMIAKYQEDRSFDGLTIHSMLLANRDKNIKVSLIQDYITKNTDNKPDLMKIYNTIPENEKNSLASEGASIKKN